MSKPSDFYPGQRVMYVPMHAYGNVRHPDCEEGVVSSVNEKYVFVSYIKNGRTQHTTQATDADDLLAR